MADLVTDNAETLAEALAKHRLHASMNICTGCDWRATPDAGSLADQHEAHRAAALIASGAVRPAAEVRAEALREAADAEYQRDGATLLVERLLARAALAEEGGVTTGE